MRQINIGLPETLHLEWLLERSDQLMLQRARAAYLLQTRGYDISDPATLNKQSL